MSVVGSDYNRAVVRLAGAWVSSRPNVTSGLISRRALAHVDQAFAAESLPLDESVKKGLTG
ncbi:MAG: hypothetical protein DWQ34_20390 [Planctomycetota bacterium]|nr:MAG: hypothetical protein DWQ29_10435 [Planctomycetota bacterium]REJ89121.1 MAG: hypothetical protein DWQ34_20390 [Planctomycetota bacterium]REK29784.1 MAG: hypothetical protein DWQ41_03905 [Planctomycetota bacterium]REK30396.1 MAG: hypothetical protein DWQ45_21130 [Planctomycetota bacterium]